MPITSFDILERSPYQNGVDFAPYGSYERIDASLKFNIDPLNEANQGIADLSLAPRDSSGQVRFRSDLVLITPSDPDIGNGCLIIDVVNRGQPLTPRLNRAIQADAREIPPGDGFLFRHGYSIAAVGWQWDVLPEIGLGLDAPVAEKDGQPITGQVMVEFRPDRRERTRLLANIHLANRVHKAHPAIDIHEQGARLLVRDYEDGEVTEIPRSAWQFARETPNGDVPSTEHITLDSGFEPGRIYHVIYTTSHAPVVGVGMLALRESASFLRVPSAQNPRSRGFERTIAFGVSQTGRLLRTLLYFGLNISEDGEQAFDGMLVHVAGGRLGEFNHRFAQPSVQPQPGFGHLPPFSDESTTDPFTGKAEGLLNRVRSLGVTPRIVYTPSSAEYWRGDGSLAHIDARGEHDLPEAPETRTYHLAGTQHGAGSLPLRNDLGSGGTKGRYYYNVVDYTPLQRAALLNLDAWVAKGIEPPPSRHPRVDDGTAVSPHTTLPVFKSLGLNTPDPNKLWRIRTLDLGPDADQRVGTYPPIEGETYTSLVSAIDTDGNEVAGVRLPDLTVPVGSHIPWNLRHPSIGSPEQIISMLGSTIFFAPTREARHLSNDPRPSIEERYPSRESYLEQVRKEAQILVNQRYLLAEDMDLVIHSCAERYDTSVVVPDIIPRNSPH